MVAVKWLDSFNLGHEQTDRDHLELIDRVVSLEAKLAGGDFDSANASCRALRGFMESHFLSEERLMLDTAFPRLVEHFGSHALEREKLDSILAECGENCSKGLEIGCTTRWSVAMLNHILSDDQELKSYLKDEETPSDR